MKRYLRRAILLGSLMGVLASTLANGAPAPIFAHTSPSVTPTVAAYLPFVAREYPLPPFALTASFNGVEGDLSAFAPDPHIAAGPNSLILITNVAVTIMSTAGAPIATKRLSQFFAPVLAPGEGGGDVGALYDPDSNRFFLSMGAGGGNSNCTPGTCVSHNLLAVSKTANPLSLESTDWFFYALDRTLNRTPQGTAYTANWGDFDHLGIDDNVVVITSREYSFQDQSPQGAKIRVLNKATLVNNLPVTTWVDFVGMTDAGGRLLYAGIQPAITFGSSGTFYLVSRAGCAGFVLWGIQNALTAPQLISTTVTTSGPCADPPDAVQPGGAPPINVDVPGLNVQPVYRNGYLWAADTVRRNYGTGDVAAIRWAQIDVSAWPASTVILQDATLGFDSASIFLPALMVDDANNMALFFTRASASEFPSLYFTGRLSTGVPGALRPVTLVKTGAAPVDLVALGVNRYGDYFGIASDPTDSSVWMFGEYMRTSTLWGTWVGHMNWATGP